jgi:hypothetical protein
MKQKKPDPILSHRIIACLVCGSPISMNCEHRGQLTMMSKARAAAIAISYAYNPETDFKRHAAGDTE